MKTLYLEKASLAELFKLIEDRPAYPMHIFRGQADAGWDLVPSLYRSMPTALGGTKKEIYDAWKEDIINLFFKQSHPYLPPIKGCFANNRVLAQHFGVPTRLLDWSADPLVALFFAVEDWKKETDAALYMICPEWSGEPRKDDIINFDQVVAYYPPIIDQRIAAQKSIFTFHSYGRTDREDFVALNKRPEVGLRIEANQIFR